MPDPTFKVVADEKALVDSTEAAAKKASEKLVSNIEKAASRGATSIERILGTDLSKKLGGSAGLQKMLSKEFSALGQSTQMKQATKSISEGLARTVSKDFGAKVSAKDIQKVLNRTIQESEREAKVQEGGLFSRLFFGRGGVERFKSQFSLTTRTMGQSITRNVQAPMMGVMGSRGGALAAGGMGGARAGMGLIGGGALGVGLGTVGMLGLAGIGLAGAGAAGAVSYGKRAEDIRMRMGTMMDLPGNIAGGRRGTRQIGRGIGRQTAGMIGIGRAANYLPEEVAQIAAPAFQAGAGKDIRSVVRAERAFGMGGDLTALMGAQAQRGERIQRGRGRREMQGIIEAAMASKLEKGRWGEVARGMAAMTTSKGVGIGADTTAIVDGLKSIREGFRGAEGMQVLQGMETAVTGGRTPMGRAMALQAAGLGRTGFDFSRGRPEGVGGDIFAAERRMELGMFGKAGEKTGGGVGMFKDILRQAKGLHGFGAAEEVGTERENADAELRRGAMIKQMAMNMGLTMNATEKLIGAIEKGETNQDELKKIAEEGEPLQKQAYKAMIKMGDFKSLEVAFDRLMAQMFKTLRPMIMRLIEWVKKAIRGTESLLRLIRSSGLLGNKSAEEIGEEKREERRVRVFTKNPEMRKLSRQSARQASKEYLEESQKGGFGSEMSFRKSKYMQYFARTGKLPEEGEAGVKQVTKMLELQGPQAAKLGGGLLQPEIRQLSEKILDGIVKIRQEKIQVEANLNIRGPNGEEKRTTMENKRAQRGNRGAVAGGR